MNTLNECEDCAAPIQYGMRRCMECTQLALDLRRLRKLPLDERFDLIKERIAAWAEVVSVCTACRQRLTACTCCKACGAALTVDCICGTSVY